MLIDIDVRRRVGGRIIGVTMRTDTGISALFGPSGIGKTTILHMVAGLIRPDEGHIRIDGTLLFDHRQAIDIPSKLRGCGYVFQDTRLFPHLRVRANLLYGRRGEGPASLSTVIDLLGLDGLLDRWPITLSGGEAQRVAIGRALLSGPQILLMDEPLSSLDDRRKAGLLGLIRDIPGRTGIPILYVTHDAAEIDALDATRIDVLNPA
ncbi:Sulfate/thiosulfate import ATP-binding protein CysA [Sphingobium sp. AntQ-1]|uniref:ATP-binding cassette domain-containing protein n=1 Tax=Sphingobium sp. AntQ-1 TaxID=2930091 RepID=UPI00234F50BA|nr:ATP-binding cassette domain-containing protein [Sphingobium sp. AntQ-1]WCP14247.1 Sulfate/thiosulfate import ATP-binding protein CysA [Sphingobium sp. AntQ-1]